MGVFRIEEADRPHLLRLLIIWVVLSIVGILAALQIHYPPYDQSVQGQDQSRTLALLTILALPVFIGVVIMVLYSAIYFRRTTTELIDGPPMLGNTPVQIAWIAISAALVLFLAVVGIVTLASSNVAQAVNAPGRAIGQSGGQTGSGTAGGAGPELQVQVVAQQWYFTYRYADYGGVETTHLYLPVDRPVELHVTSLDIIHSFWAYQLGVKADANPGVDNIFHVTPQKTGSFQVRCAELCGLWHGHMADSEGQVVSQSEFDTWIAQQQKDYEVISKAVPSYAPFYFPEPLLKAG
ncbi:MAG: cytochrome c oxidase subunit II [Chloroflexi bacterium]|nr:MAG: cytochrome c oxidase subunit II [Chloroflexota bacterium]TMD66666.1 MAG: cytochrome c oxidase subunit II [Chloroflexota bacterium]